MFKVKIISFEEMFKKCVICLTNKNILFVKIIQWFTFDLTDDEDINERLYKFVRSYCDQAPYNQNDIDVSVIRKLNELKDDSGKNYLIIDEVPSFTGSIALCFKGKYYDQKVIIKIQRINIEEKIISLTIFVNKILYFLYILEYIGFVQKGSHEFIKKIVNKNIECFNEQGNFKIECENLVEIYNLYKDTDCIIIPKVYPNFTEKFPNIIIMEQLEPYTLLPNEVESKEYMNILIEFMITSFYITFAFHMDLHMGNIMFMKRNEKLALGIIDFGYVGKATTINEQNIAINFLNHITQKFDMDNKYDVVMCLCDCICEQEDISNDLKIKIEKFCEEHRKNIKTLMNNEDFLKFYTFILKENIQLNPFYILIFGSISPIIGSITKLALIQRLPETRSNPIRVLFDSFIKQMQDSYNQY